MDKKNRRNPHPFRIAGGFYLLYMAFSLGKDFIQDMTHGVKSPYPALIIVSVLAFFVIGGWLIIVSVRGLHKDAEEMVAMEAREAALEEIGATGETEEIEATGETEEIEEIKATVETEETAPIEE